MSNDLTDFLSDMTEGEEASSSKFPGMVGKVLVQFGYHKWVNGMDGETYWNTWAEAKTKADKPGAMSKSANAIAEMGSNEAPSFGIRITLFADVLTSDQPYSKDLSEFVASWQSADFSHFQKCFEEANADGYAKVNKSFYGQVRKEPKPYGVAKGEAGKTDTDMNGEPDYPRMMVVKQAFKNKAAAEDFIASFEDAFVSVADKELADAFNGKADDSIYDKLSDTARAAYPDKEKFNNMYAVITESLNDMILDFIKEDIPLKEAKLKAAKMGDLTQDDLKLFKLELPF